ncbi:hypothetical protein LEMLEM_LOCUS26619 [Lemmus lemmus]
MSYKPMVVMCPDGKARRLGSAEGI